MSVTVIVEVQAKPDRAEEVAAIFEGILPETRAYEGCQGLRLVRNLDDAANLLVIERWASREHYERYLAWRVESGLVGRVEAMAAAPPSIRFFEQVAG